MELETTEEGRSFREAVELPGSSAHTAGERWPLAWRASMRLLLIWPALLGLIGAALCLWQEEARFAELLLLSCAGLQAAQALVPNDEPALELLLSYPRPAWMLLGERLGLGLGLGLGSLLLYALAAWLRGLEADLVQLLPALLLCCGIGTLLTLRTRQLTLGGIAVVLLVVGAWRGFDAALGRWEWLWPLHPLLPAAHEHALANRLIITFIGLALLALALRRTMNEPALLGLKDR